MGAKPEVEKQVREVLDRWRDAYASKDVDALLKTFSDDDDVLVFGTGADEVRLGQEQLREQAQRDFDQSDSLELETGEIRISTSGDAAWATMDSARVDADAGGQTMSLPIRATILLMRGGDGWLIHHAHVSVPMAGQEEGESFPTDAG